MSTALLLSFHATDSDTFDLAGKNAATIERAVKDAFEKPFALSDTIRITFVTGAGKLARQKYDDMAAKAVTGPLKDLGYEDDAGGGAGTYKLQHDTGKNLKTVVVYPKVEPSTVEGATARMENMSVAASLIPEGTPEHKIAFASISTFDRMIGSMCPSWSQKKGCMAAIEQLNSTIQGLDQKLMTGTPLSESEQEFYDSVSAQSLSEKAAKVKDLMHTQVEKSELTSSEKAFLLKQVSERLDNLQTDLTEAEGTKRVETIKKNLEKANKRKEMLEKITARPPHPLKNNDKIAKLRIELAPLLKLEAETKGRLLSLKESQSMARKEHIEAEIIELEDSSRGWFETDDEFATRVEASRKATKPAAPQSKKSSKSSSSTNNRTTSWVTPGSTAWGTKKKTATKPTTGSKPKANKGSGVFAAMMMDSDSD
jgi:hypothetical protein